MVLVAAGKGDGREEVEWMAAKIPALRIFPDESGKMNLGLAEIGGEMLVVSQFTLYGECRKGKRPSFSGAASHQEARALYDAFVSLVRASGIPVREGVFGEMMEVELVNDGPVTLIVDTPHHEGSPPR
jgi:D-tyrosyl-tRNA(Tyr) deacylase